MNQNSNDCKQYDKLNGVFFGVQIELELRKKKTFFRVKIFFTRVFPQNFNNFCDFLSCCGYRSQIFHGKNDHGGRRDDRVFARDDQVGAKDDQIFG